MPKRMASRKRTAAFLTVVLLVLTAATAFAQDYSFRVDETIVDLYIEADGNVRIVYDLTFTPSLGSHPIDVADIGLPNSTYRVSEVQASINGISLEDISNSPYVTHGVAVELGGQTIPPGQSGTLHVEATVHDMIYQDEDDSEYASIVFSPTWFDSQFVHGTNYLAVSFHFPPGVTGEETRYHGREFTTAGFENDRVVYTWVDENADASKQYMFGASFPKAYLDEGVVQKPPAFTINFGSLCTSPIMWFLLFGGGWIAISVLGARSQKRRKMKYLPPALAVEGTGVKRGLTAVEAAVVLEAPLNKVVTMILFGLVKKGAITVEAEKPLKVTVHPDLPEDAKLWYYERRFLKAVRDNGTINESALREMTIDLIGDVNKKLTGFSRRETKAYYKDIAARAWGQVEAAETPDVLGRRWGSGLEWTMLDDDWDDRTRRVFHDRPVVLPTWWGHYRPWGAATGRATPSAPSAPRPVPSGGGTPVTLPTLPGADFANTVVGGIENAANTVVTSLESFTSGVTRTTNPPPKRSSSSSSSSHSGGYSCACACACAGCACACAGGGR